MKISLPKSSSLLGYYTVWHYGRAYSDIYKIWMNFLWFVFYFFSISFLFSTLFEPWKRMGEAYPIGFDPALAIQTFVVNMLMRFVGFLTRFIVITIGLILALIVFVLGLLVFVLWTLIPVLFVALVIMGFFLTVFG